MSFNGLLIADFWDGGVCNYFGLTQVEREKVEITHSERRRGLKKCTTSGEWGG